MVLMSAVIIKRVTDLSELTGIKDLQAANLKTLISEEEATSQGFLSATYSPEFLEQMHLSCPSIVAKDGDEVVGYALVTTQENRYQHDLLADLFNTIDTLSYNQKPLKESRYVVVGQLCVAKAYRGQGLVQQLYGQFKAALCDQFDFCVTDVAQANQRSLKAHIKTGFEVIDTLHYGGIGWDIVLWDWTKR